MGQSETQTTEERARRRARYLSGLVWHAGTFVIINAFFWILDIIGVGGVNWAFWITGFWGFALAFHALAYYVDGRQLEERKTQQYLDEERRREAPRTCPPDERGACGLMPAAARWPGA